MARMGFNIKPMQKKGSRGGKERRGEKGGGKTGKRERERERLLSSVIQLCPKPAITMDFSFLKYS